MRADSATTEDYVSHMMSATTTKETTTILEVT